MLDLGKFLLVGHCSSLVICIWFAAESNVYSGTLDIQIEAIQLTGSFPSWISNMSNLEILYLGKLLLKGLYDNFSDSICFVIESHFCCCILDW